MIETDNLMIAEATAPEMGHLADLGCGEPEAAAQLLTGSAR